MVNERKFHHKKSGDDYMGGFNSPKGDTEMFSDKKTNNVNNITISTINDILKKLLMFRSFS